MLVHVLSFRLLMRALCKDFEMVTRLNADFCLKISVFEQPGCWHIIELEVALLSEFSGGGDRLLILEGLYEKHYQLITSHAI